MQFDTLQSTSIRIRVRDSSIRSNRMKALMPDDSRDPEDRLIDETDPLAKKDKMLDKTHRRYIPSE